MSDEDSDGPTLDDLDLDTETLDLGELEADGELPDDPAERDDFEYWYPTVNDIVGIHDAVIEEDEDSEPGVRDPEQLEFPVNYIEHGHFGQVPETIHEKAFHLMRLLAANHYFVDGNKRTALNTTSMFYLLNGYNFESGKDMRALLKLFSVREDIIDRDVGTEYFSERVQPLTQEDLDEMGFWELVLILFARVDDWEVPDEDSLSMGFHLDEDDS